MASHHCLIKLVYKKQYLLVEHYVVSLDCFDNELQRTVRAMNQLFKTSNHREMNYVYTLAQQLMRLCAK